MPPGTRSDVPFPAHPPLPCSRLDCYCLSVYNGARSVTGVCSLKTAVQFGAGNIGRGFTGELFSESGLEVVFVDVVPEVVDALNGRHGYTITIAKEPEETVEVRNVRAVNGRDVSAVAEEVAGCEVACTAVGVNVLGTIAAPIAKGIELRMARKADGTLNIIVCENMRDAAGALRQMVAEKLSPEASRWAAEHVGFSQAVVGRMVPVRTADEKKADPVGIRVEPYKKLPVDADALVGSLPEVPGVLVRHNFQAYIDQKLFAHNAGHAASAYFGALKGLEYLWQCMADAEVRAQAHGLMEETGKALISRYGLDAEEHWAHVEDLLNRFANRKLGDTVARVGGDPMRKLGREDRLVGAGVFCLEEGVEPEHVAGAIAAGYRFNNPADRTAPKVQEIVATKGIEEALQEVSGISPSSGQPHEKRLAEMVLRRFRAIR